MTQDFIPIPDELFGHERPTDRPQVARERFTPSKKAKEFLNDCRDKDYDVSTIINLAIESFAPKTKSNGYSWDGIDNVIKGKKKWY